LGVTLGRWSRVNADSTVGELACALVDLGRLALAFGRIDRTAVYHPDGVTPESDTDHTVMLGWLACAVAGRCFPQLDMGLVAQFALVHDAPELYAGDTPTLRISAAGRAAKAAREHAALCRLVVEFGERLPWFPEVITVYEAQLVPEARFVRGMDKILPKIVHVIDGATGLVQQGMRRAELAEVFTRQRADLAGYVGEFAEVLQLHAELAGHVLDHPMLADPAARTTDVDPLDRLNSPHTAGCLAVSTDTPVPELCACGGETL
jgi:putative hydrolase of HD superfamily